MKYKDELIRSMEFLAQDERTIFLGQSVKFSGREWMYKYFDIKNSKLYTSLKCWISDIT